ncbi:hypothetical protein COCSUDRAFT_62949 [Coccomyxa subellipsoidea C-169]|uniref:Uncharacterized protein n=1 Tax=Coccomyxa subellipsoidea (strain C-169) TaxID=574566 RepID=I0YYE5_COCSC|nr:hypothetical protein COCSUDRAFT_62949 [Coccomyxa subellipsoidea C-169]EIE23414.1 hypothetical protein COCSUDRAFT_62949 [Coccomyxa subellipsoidea C-169]|eukprot:XP_005647958.1 hypothetical protein COCSUDRAFT_62949 [Coccomyxa subellipsoidea C-169]
MRRECAQLARQLEAAFAVIYLPCNLEDTSARNALRSEAERVPQEVLNRMAARLEPPDPSKHAWERSTVTLPIEELPSPSNVWTGVWEAILRAWGPPLPRAVPTEPRGPATAASATAAHEADLRSRRAIAAAVAFVTTREGKAAAAGRLNAARRKLLARLQKDEEWRDSAAELADFEQLCKDVATE